MERIAALDRAVRAGEYPNAVSFAGRVEVDPRTVQRDIEFLRDRFRAPLVFDRRRNGYAYSDPHYRLSFLDLGEDELIALFLAEGVLRQYHGTRYAADLARACRKIAAGVSADLASSHSFRISAPRPTDPVVHQALEKAIRDRRRLAILYYSASRDEETRREVDPMHLVNVDGQFYLVAFCHLRQCVRTFVPTRIRSIEATGAAFDPPASFDIDAYLADSFAVLRGDGDEAHRVRLRFTGEAVRYVRERRWHPSQSVEETPDGGLILSLTVGHLREVERFVLSWGHEAEVLEPSSFRSRVGQILTRAAARYAQPLPARDLVERPEASSS